MYIIIKTHRNDIGNLLRVDAMENIQSVRCVLFRLNSYAQTVRCCCCLCKVIVRRQNLVTRLTNVRARKTLV